MGVAIIWRNLLTKFIFDIPNIQYFIYIVALYGLLLMSLYLLKVLLHFPDFLQDLNMPPKLAGLGSLSMSISLFGSLLTMEQLKVDMNVVIAVVLFGAFVQFLSMCRFFRLCWLESSYPEPYWNAAVLSSVFPAITLPNLHSTNYEFVLRIRQAYHILAWCFFVWIIPVMIYRTVVMHRPVIHSPAIKENTTTDKSLTIPPANTVTVVVAPNPSVCLLQAGTSIMCSAWHRTPSWTSVDSREGRIVSHTTFAISTVGLLITITAIWQRRHQLRNFGYKDIWAASTFPFCNTAIAAGLYYSVHKDPLIVLQLWVWTISIIASLIVLCVNIMFIYHTYYLTAPPSPAPPIIVMGDHMIVSQQDVFTTHTDEIDSCSLSDVEVTDH